jgi:formamidopyrimidine-DNA glycosylase
MPELPDLSVFSANLNKALKGKKVKAVNAAVAKNLNVTKAALEKAIVGQTINSVYREGKELHIGFGDDTVVGLHLMLHGELYLFEKEHEHKYVILELTFGDKTGLVLTDYQKMAKVNLDPEINDAPDALAKEINFKFLKELLQSKGVVKRVLMDQDKIRGIGNAYADEILYKAGISPLSVSNMIPDDYVRALGKAIKTVLTGAEKQIRKKHPDIISGEVRDFLLIHNPEKTESPEGYAIEMTKVGGRATYYTAEQELFK